MAQSGLSARYFTRNDRWWATTRSRWSSPSAPSTQTSTSTRREPTRVVPQRLLVCALARVRVYTGPLRAFFDVAQVNDLMSHEGWNLNALHRPAAVHMCLTQANAQSVPKLLQGAAGGGALKPCRLHFKPGEAVHVSLSCARAQISARPWRRSRRSRGLSRAGWRQVWRHPESSLRPSHCFPQRHVLS